VQTWPKQHHNLLAIVLLCTGAGVVTWFMSIRPLLHEVHGLRAAVANKNASLSQSGWHLDVQHLENQLNERNRQADNIDQRARDVINHANAMFAARVKQLYGSAEIFRQEVSRLDFQEEYNQAERKLQARGIALSETLTNLGENTSSAHTYQLLWQLWTLTEALEVAWEKGLQPQVDNTVSVTIDDGRKLPAARVRVLPVRAYSLSPNHTEVFLIEFPIHLQLRGNVANLVQFIQALNSGNRYLPVTGIEIKKQPPSVANPNLDQLAIDIHCSSFFILNDELPKPRQEQLRIIPRGA